jgi:hypothetical protein
MRRPTSRRSCGAATNKFREIPLYLKDFVDCYDGRFHDVQLPLHMRL